MSPLSHLFVHCPRLSATATMAALVAGLGVWSPSASAQSVDWQSTVSACVPADAQTLANEIVKAKAGKIVSQLGPNPPKLTYTCNVLNPEFAVNVPVWQRMTLQYLDVVGNGVTASLMQKSKVTGATAQLAVAVSPAAAVVSNVSVPIPALNFANFFYYIVVEVQPKGAQAVEAHGVVMEF